MAIPIGSRMVKRPITERTIRALATPESFARGRSYFDDSAVSDLVRRGDRLTAEVEGSELAPYRVSIRLHDGGVAEARCSCPYDLGGYCKHIVAVLLKFADEGTRVIERKTLAKLLRELDQSRLIELLEKRAESDLELAAWIEAELATTVEPSSLRNKEVGRRRTPVDPEPVREHTRNLLAKRQRRGRYWDGYRASGDLEELQRLVEKAVPFIEVGDGSNALRILEPIAEAFVDDWLEHSFGSDEHLYELFADLGRLMAEAALMSDLSADERDALAQTLEDWQTRLEEYGVDEGFHVAIRALQTAWDVIVHARKKARARDASASGCSCGSDFRLGPRCTRHQGRWSRCRAAVSSSICSQPTFIQWRISLPWPPHSAASPSDCRAAAVRLFELVDLLEALVEIRFEIVPFGPAEMWCAQHVRHFQERMIAVHDRLLVIHVNGRVTGAALLQRFQKRAGLHQFGARNVDEQRRQLHAGEILRTDQALTDAD
jgi:hypothetical protein